MADFQYARGGQVGASADMSVDAGLRGFMLGIYNKMALGLLLSAVLAYAAGTVEPIRDLLFVMQTGMYRGELITVATPTLLGWIVSFAPLGLLLVSSFAMRNPSPTSSGILYWSIVAFLGVGMGSLVVTYGSMSDGLLMIGKAFFVTAAAFGGLSLWGYTTKRDLSGFGSFLVMGVIGLVVAMVVNMFLQSDMMHFIISCVGVLIFSGLVAFDTQRLKHTYYALGGDQRSMAVATNYGALSLYINFINLFQFILSLMSRD